MVRFVKRSRCKKISRWIGPYCDGELSEGPRSLVDEHLEDCPTCRLEYDRLRQTGELFRQGFAASTAGEDLDLENLSHRIREEIRLSEMSAKEVSFGQRLQESWFQGTKVLLPSALVAALIAVFIFTIYKSPPSVIKQYEQNECIIDSIEGEKSTVMFFKTLESKITVIWISESEESGGEEAGLWRESIA
jgi:hypothetical protein